MWVGWGHVFVTWRFCNHGGRFGPCICDVMPFWSKTLGWGTVFVTYRFLDQRSSVEPQCKIYNFCNTFHLYCRWNVLQKCKIKLQKYWSVIAKIQTTWFSSAFNIDVSSCAHSRHGVPARTMTTSHLMRFCCFVWEKRYPLDLYLGPTIPPLGLTGHIGRLWPSGKNY